MRRALPLPQPEDHRGHQGLRHPDGRPGHRPELDGVHRGNAAPDFGLRTLTQAAADLGGSVDIDAHGGIAGGARLTLHLPEAP